MSSTSFFLLLITLEIAILPFPQLTTSTLQSLRRGESLDVEKPEDVLLSPSGVFWAGFFPVGDLAYCFGVRFRKPSPDGNSAVVWVANRDQPVNGKNSKLSLSTTAGELILDDAGQFITWRTNTVSESSSLQLLLQDTGNLVLSQGSRNRTVLWESFSSPTDTLLTGQQLTRSTKLISSRSKWNYSSGYYKLSFDDSNVLRLVFDDSTTSSIYWPDPWMEDAAAGRTKYNDTRIAVLGASGRFTSSDKVDARAADFGSKLIRRMVLDDDGNLRMYSLNEATGTWAVSWQAVSDSCRIHGICGENGVCIYDPSTGHKCSCLPRFRIRDPGDWSRGCDPEFGFSCKKKEQQNAFVPLHHVDFYGYNYQIIRGSSFQECKDKCLELCCKGFQFRFLRKDNNFSCYLKKRLRNGHRSLNLTGTMYLRAPKSYESLYEVGLNCSGFRTQSLTRAYVKAKENAGLKILLWFASAFGLVELACVLMACVFLYGSLDRSKGYVGLAFGCRRYSYGELKRATRGFSQVIGRGASGVVYKGVLLDNRVAAVKRLNEGNQGEDEFLAEVSTIGKLNHMNLIDMWGYCSEGKHRLLVSEFMEEGSLEDKLCNNSNSLGWKERFDMAVGTAKGLAYLHDECLEWVLHCDVKPQNILLDSRYNPKVSDFGLSKMIKGRKDEKSTSFSRIRGTRGYMAPEWILNKPITSKADVYSYGVVVMEMVTGRNPENAGELVAWIRQKKVEAEKEGSEESKSNWVKQAMDPLVGADYEADELGVLLGVALQCMEEEPDARPSMSRVVDMLLRH